MTARLIETRCGRSDGLSKETCAPLPIGLELSKDIDTRWYTLIHILATLLSMFSACRGRMQ